MTLIFASTCLLIGAALILLCDAFALRKKGYLNKSEKVGLVAGIISSAIGLITFVLGNDFVIPFVWRGVIVAVGIGIISLSVIIPRRPHASAQSRTQPETERSTTPAFPSLTYGRIIIKHNMESQHQGTYHYSDYFLEVMNSTPNTVAKNCQASFDLYNNSDITDFVAFWNKNNSDIISIGHPELLKLFTVSIFYKGNRRVDTKLLFYIKSKSEDDLDYFNIPYGENMNRELCVLLQSENARYPSSTEAFCKTIKYIIDNSVEE